MKKISVSLVVRAVAFLCCVFLTYKFFSASTNVDTSFVSQQWVYIWFISGVISVIGAITIALSFWEKVGKVFKLLVVVIMVIGVLMSVINPIMWVGMPHVIVAILVGLIGVILIKQDSSKKI